MFCSLSISYKLLSLTFHTNSNLFFCASLSLYIFVLFLLSWSFLLFFLLIDHKCCHSVFLFFSISFFICSLFRRQFQLHCLHRMHQSFHFSPSRRIIQLAPLIKCIRRDRSNPKPSKSFLLVMCTVNANCKPFHFRQFLMLLFYTYFDVRNIL